MRFGHATHRARRARDRRRSARELGARRPTSCVSGRSATRRRVFVSFFFLSRSAGSVSSHRAGGSHRGRSRASSRCATTRSRAARTRGMSSAATVPAVRQLHRRGEEASPFRATRTPPPIRYVFRGHPVPGRARGGKARSPSLHLARSRNSTIRLRAACVSQRRRTPRPRSSDARAACSRPPRSSREARYCGPLASATPRVTVPCCVVFAVSRGALLGPFVQLVLGQPTPPRRPQRRAP